MLVLALDTALDTCQAALVRCDGTATLLARSAAPSAGDAEALADHVAAVLAEAQVSADAVARVAVTVGPGSFTGVRVGLAYAKGFAFAHDVPVLGITTLEALGASHGAPSVAVVDARHGAVYAALTAPGRAPTHMGKYEAMTAQAMAVHEGLPLVGPTSALATVGDGVATTIDVTALAKCALVAPDERPPRAAYLSPVDAVPSRHKALARA